MRPEGTWSERSCSVDLADAALYVEDPIAIEGTVLFGIVAALLAIAAGLLYRNRLETVGAEEPVVLDDDLIRQIENHGWVEIEEPLDLDHIREQEQRFLEEYWDESED